jgi:aminoglycoside phosphotransferase
MSLPAMDHSGSPTEKSTTAGASPDLVDPDSQKKANLTVIPDAELDLPRPSWLQKQLLFAAIRLVRKFRRHTSSVLMLTKDLCVKYGSSLDLVKAQSMVYIAKNTGIPVPKVHLAFTHKGCTYILMQRIHGHMLAQGWVKRSPESQQRVLASLKNMILEMRTLRSHGHDNLICSVNGGSLYDGRLPGDTWRFGPFKDVQAFHNYLRDDIQAHNYEDVTKLIDMHQQHWDVPTFTHGDLSSLNILVRADDVVGIVDWETAGWYPAYWEYTTACQVNPQNEFWKNYIDGFLEPMPEALAMEKLRQRYFGVF